jgi:chemotaxis family two-component system response regulator Rcp1
VKVVEKSFPSFIKDQLLLHHLLLVEDNPADQRLACEVWEESSSRIKLHIVGDGSEASDFLYRKAKYHSAPVPDLIILDLNLPKKHGSELLEEIKNDPMLKRIPVVILTTSNSRVDIANSYDLHANCYLMKPLDYDAYLDILRSIESFWLNFTQLPPKKISSG